ncbi:MAG: glycosyltransferase family 39 protein, partial [Planctomycetaceae bacterium]|nr:glycosyltransferase family 39 protein [Planctomycetaceae bacterium]
EASRSGDRLFHALRVPFLYSPSPEYDMPSASRMKPVIAAGVVFAMAFAVSARCVNHGLVSSSVRSGPGLTLDESFNVGQGIYLFESALDHGPLMFTPSGAEQVFGRKGYLPDHPPLGRLLLGAAHQTFATWFDGNLDAPFCIPAARLGSSLAFALTCGLLTAFAAGHYGIPVGFCAGCLLMQMPRMLGHSRIASLETATGLFWLLTSLGFLQWWTGPHRPSGRQSFVSGIAWGLLLLTKVQGILIPPLITGWAFYQFGWRAVRPLSILAATGLAVFLFGWPWLWLDPAENLMTYLGRAADRPTLYVWYFGQRYADKLVPWHYPFVLLFATTPLFVILPTAFRCLRGRLDAVERLCLTLLIWPLIVFALPGTPVYDGVRLFLVVLPLLALLAGRGLVMIFCPLSASDSAEETASGSNRCSALIRLSVVLLLVFSAVLEAAPFSPYLLDRYSVVAGLNSGAVNRLGLEACYWADALNGDFWNQVPEASVVYVAPVSHQFQLQDLESLVPVIRDRKIRLAPFEYDPQAQRGLTLLIHRLADLRPALRHVPQGATVLAEVISDGVVLARLIDTTNATWPEIPDWPNESGPLQAHP